MDQIFESLKTLESELRCFQTIQGKTCDKKCFERLDWAFHVVYAKWQAYAVERRVGNG